METQNVCVCVIILSLIQFMVASESNREEGKRYPHIILIIADDLGFNDVSFHGSPQIPTPNLDALAHSGIILNNYYVSPICTPSRAALFTGKHPIHTGMQQNVIYGATPYGLPLSHKILPEYLKEFNYSTHLVGKWHLGHYRRCYTPLCRGFDSHFGHWTGHKDYYDNTAQESGPQAWGYDTRRGFDISYDHFGEYTTDVYTHEAQQIIQTHNAKNKKTKNCSRQTGGESIEKSLFLVLSHTAVHSANPYKLLQAPEDTVKKFEYIKDPARRTYAAMVSKLDDSVGSIVQTLEENAMLNDSIIIFTTDNGGPANGFNGNYASNWPLRGVKNTLLEGGVRGVGFIWSPLLKSTPYVSTKLMHIQDWLPTIIHGALGERNENIFQKLDGIDMWEALNFNNVSSPRTHLLHNIDDSYGNEGVRSGDWKLLKGTTYDGRWDGWYGPSGFEPNTPSVSLDTLSSDIQPNYNKSQQWESIQQSNAGKAILKLKNDGMLKNETLFEILKTNSQVLCNKPKNMTKNHECNLKSGQYCLFNVKDDPCEYINLANENPNNMLQKLIELLKKYRASAVKPENKPKDQRGYPKFFNYTWTNFMDYIQPEQQKFEINNQVDLNSSYTVNTPNLCICSSY